MWTLMFAIGCAISGIGWLSRYISCTAIIYYMEKKGYRLPNDKEIEECTQFVVKNLFK